MDLRFFFPWVEGWFTVSCGDGQKFRSLWGFHSVVVCFLFWSRGVNSNCQRRMCTLSFIHSLTVDWTGLNWTELNFCLRGSFARWWWIWAGSLFGWYWDDKYDTESVYMCYVCAFLCCTHACMWAVSNTFWYVCNGTVLSHTVNTARVKTAVRTIMYHLHILVFWNFPSIISFNQASEINRLVDTLTSHLELFQGPGSCGMIKYCTECNFDITNFEQNPWKLQQQRLVEPSSSGKFTAHRTQAFF